MIILVTGANSGFGKLMTDAALAQGHTVIACMRQVEKRRALFAKNENLHFVELDLNEREDRENVARTIREQFQGKLDVLINNAGYGAYGALEDASDEFIDYQIQTNFNSQAKLTRDLLPYLRAAKGRIYFMSSIMGLVAMPLSSLYCASKFALEGLARGLAYELAPFDVQVTTVCPGRHRTDFAHNLKWAREDIEQSAYHKLYRGLMKMMTRMREGKAVPAENVSRAVIKSLGQKRLPQQIIVGQDALSLAMLKKLLPVRLYFSLTNFVFHKGVLK